MVVFDFSLSPWPWPFIPWTSPSKWPFKSWNSFLCLPHLQIFHLKHPRPCQTGYLLEKLPRGKIQVFPPVVPLLLFTRFFFLWFALWAVSSLQPVNYPGIQRKYVQQHVGSYQFLYHALLQQPGENSDCSRKKQDEQPQVPCWSSSPVTLGGA